MTYEEIFRAELALRGLDSIDLLSMSLSGLMNFNQVVAEKFARMKWEQACEAQKIICAQNAEIRHWHGEDWRIVDESILNSPKPEYR